VRIVCLLEDCSVTRSVANFMSKNRCCVPDQVMFGFDLQVLVSIARAYGIGAQEQSNLVASKPVKTYRTERRVGANCKVKYWLC
jgi:hypothetical protein